ncbi:MAG: hypothetical protein IJ620_06270, partial [Bacteroidales bacterium]|nr:hypothetical protein [Bacteroidales bacterium]
TTITDATTAINATIAANAAKVDSIDAAINTTIAANDAKVDSIDAAINATIATNDAKVDSIDGAINTTITDATTAINATIAANAAKVDSIDAAHDAAITANAALATVVDSIADTLSTLVAANKLAAETNAEAIAANATIVDSIADTLSTLVAANTVAIADNDSIINAKVDSLYNLVHAKAIADSTTLQDSIDKVAAMVMLGSFDPDSVSAIAHDTAKVIRAEYEALHDNHELRIVELKGRVDNLSDAGNIDGVLTLGNDAGAKQIKNVADPTEDQDVATKAYVDILAHLVDSLRNEISRLTSSLNRLNTYGDTTVYATSDLIAAGLDIKGHTYNAFGTFNDTIGLNVNGFDTIVRIHIINTAEAFGDGTADGTVEHPYILSSEADLFAFYDMTQPTGNVFIDKSFALGADIVLTKEWTPIVAFNGTFDGANHTITFANGMAVSTSEPNVGFFATATGATIQNLALAGDVTVDVTSGTVRFGSVVAKAKNITLDNCHSTVNVTVNNTGTGSTNIGGLLGAVSSNTLTVRNSSSRASLTATINKSVNIGGLVGLSAVTSSLTITNCANNDTINATATNANVGGLVGSQSQSTVSVTIDNCYNGGILNLPVVTGTSKVGALVGNNACATTTGIQYNYINVFSIMDAGVARPMYMNSVVIDDELTNNRVIMYKNSGSVWRMYSVYETSSSTVMSSIVYDDLDSSNPFTCLKYRAKHQLAGDAEANQWQYDTSVDFGAIYMNQR